MTAAIGRLAVLLAAVIAAGNEILSQFYGLTFWPVLVLWLAAGIGAGWKLAAGFRWSRLERNPSPRPGRILLVLMALLAVHTMLAGLGTLPNSWDSMVYHLPRQVRWIQQGSLEHFPTHVLLQLFRGPFAEILQANLQILFDMDRVTKLVAWASFLLCPLFASLIAAELGTGRRLRTLCALGCMTLPIAYLEASTTKNDLMVAAWCLAFVWLVARGYATGTVSRFDAFLTGLSLGLAAFTKSSSYLLLAPALLPAGVLLLRPIRRLLLVPLLLLGFVVPNAGHWSRNLETFGTPVYSARDAEAHFNRGMSIARFLSRLSREASPHLATPVDAANRLLESAVRSLHQRLGVDVLDPATTYPDRPFRVIFLPYNEYQAGAPLHFALLVLLALLILLALLWPPFRRAKQPGLQALVWLAPATFVWLALVSRWEPYLNPRLHIVIFFLTLAVLAAVAEAVVPARAHRRLSLLFSGMFLLQLGPTLWYFPRPVVESTRRPEAEQLFRQGVHLRESYEAAAALVRLHQPHVVGLDSRGDWSWEYPLMRLIREDLHRPRFLAFEARNPSRAKAGYPTSPDLLVVLRPVESATDPGTGRRFRAVGRFQFLTVLLPDGS